MNCHIGLPQPLFLLYLSSCADVILSAHDKPSHWACLSINFKFKLTPLSLPPIYHTGLTVIIRSCYNLLPLSPSYDLFLSIDFMTSVDSCSIFKNLISDLSSGKVDQNVKHQTYNVLMLNIHINRFLYFSFSEENTPGKPATLIFCLHSKSLGV